MGRDHGRALTERVLGAATGWAGLISWTQDEESQRVGGACAGSLALPPFQENSGPEDIRGVWLTASPVPVLSMFWSRGLTRFLTQFQPGSTCHCDSCGCWDSRKAYPERSVITGELLEWPSRTLSQTRLNKKGGRKVIFRVCKMPLNVGESSKNILRIGIIAFRVQNRECHKDNAPFKYCFFFFSFLFPPSLPPFFKGMGDWHMLMFHHWSISPNAKHSFLKWERFLLLTHKKGTVPLSPQPRDTFSVSH